MVNVSHEQERERLGRLYEAMSEAELRKLAGDAAQLTDEARQVLGEEIAHRGLDISLVMTQESEAKSRWSDGSIGLQQKHWSLAHFRLTEVKRWQLAIVLLSLIAAVISLAIGQRKARLDDLYKTAVTMLDTAKARTAFKELATYRWNYANELVLRIATTNNPLDAFTGNQEAAIKLLGERGDPHTAEQLARLLRPYQGLAVRHAVADGLVKLPCSPECIRLVLDYEERMWRGDPVSENMMVREPIPEIERERQEIDRQLRAVLLRQKTDTIRALVQTYGLGDMTVSPFGLYMVVQLRLKDACSLLALDQQSRPVPDEQAVMPRLADMRRSVNAARKELNCPSPGSQ